MATTAQAAEEQRAEYARLLTEQDQYLGLLTWLARHVRIVPEAGGEVVPLIANPAQRAYLHATHGRKRVLTLKGRRTGITTIELACDFERINNQDYFSAVMTAHNDEDSTDIFEAAQLMHEHMPAAEQQRLRSSNARVISYPKRHSQIRVRTAGGKGVKRGGTLQKVHMTEVARYKAKDTADTIAGLMEATREGIVRGETTGAGASGWFYDTWQENYEQPDAEWLCLFMPWWFDLRNRLPLTDEERADFKLTSEEEGWAIPNKVPPEAVTWYRKTARRLKFLVRQEYPCSPLEAFIVTGRHFFDQANVVEMARRAKKPIKERDNGAVLIWEKPQEGVKYVAGGDPAEGTPTGDGCYLTVNRHDTAEQVARIYGRWVPKEFANRSANLCEEYNSAYLVPEDNRPEYGRRLRELGYKNLFYRRSKGGKREREPGFHTSGQTRPMMLDFLKEALEGTTEDEGGWLTMHDHLFFQELTTFEDQGGGRYEANSGKHDDSIFGAACMLQGRRRPQPKVRFLRR